MVKKIRRTIILIIGFVSILVAGNQVALWQYQISSDKLLMEYHEMRALQEYKLALKMFQTYYLESKDIQGNVEILDSLFTQVTITRDNCEIYVTARHLGAEWDNIQTLYNTLASFDYSHYSDVTYMSAKGLIGQIQNGLDHMILETKDEIDEEEQRNNTLYIHSSFTLLTVGIIIVIVISLLSVRSARGITRPIIAFLQTFKQLRAGDRNSRVNITSKDEFGEMASEFNKLFDRLNETTVTLEYFKNIIDSIYGALFVTDLSGKILSYNKTVTVLLEFDEGELQNRDITSLFSVDQSQVSKETKIDNNDLIHLLNNSDKIVSKSGKVIPVLTTCTSFTTNNEDFLIAVVHDITEKIEYQQQLEETKRKAVVAINAAQDAERTRIATELHDSLGQKLSGVYYALQETYDCVKDSTKIDAIQALVDDAITETRTISHSIMPGVLKDFGLCAALNELVSTTNKLQKVAFSFNAFDFEERTDPTIEKMLYRISQEGINNILKHSEATKATIQIFKTPEIVTLIIEDNGIGFDYASRSFIDRDGIGLLSIEERISAYNGELIINSAPGQGTEIIIEVPVKN